MPFSLIMICSAAATGSAAAPAPRMAMNMASESVVPVRAVVEVVRNQIFNGTPQAPPIADEAVMHEHPAIIGKGMAIQVGDGRRRCGARMREEKMRADVAAQMAQILVRPGGPHLMIQ